MLRRFEGVSFEEIQCILVTLAPDRTVITPNPLDTIATDGRLKTKTQAD